MHHGSVQHHQLSAKTSSLKHRSWPQGAALDRSAIGPKWRSANVAGRSMTRWFALTKPLSPPWDMSFESASLNIWSRLWFWMVGQSSKHFAKKQKAINMPKFPFCNAACDNSAHQCLSGESFPWTSGRPMVFHSIQSLEPLHFSHSFQIAELSSLFDLPRLKHKIHRNTTHENFCIDGVCCILRASKKATWSKCPSCITSQRHPSTKTLEHNAWTLGEFAFLFGILLWKKAGPWGRWGLIFLESLEHLVLAASYLVHEIDVPRLMLDV